MRSVDITTIKNIKHVYDLMGNELKEWGAADEIAIK